MTESGEVTADMVARHQRVRDFIEERYPHCHVVEIVEHAKTTYKRRPVLNAEYLLDSGMCDYQVEAVSEDPFKPSIRCMVALLHDDTLRILDDSVYFVQGW